MKTLICEPQCFCRVGVCTPKYRVQKCTRLSTFVAYDSLYHLFAVYKESTDSTFLQRGSRAEGLYADNIRVGGGAYSLFPKTFGFKLRRKL